MKKISTLLVCAGIAASAMAMPKGPTRQAQLAPGHQLPTVERVAPNLAFTTEATLNQPMRAMTDPQDNNWSVMFRMLGPAVEALGIGRYTDENDPNSWEYFTFEEFPFYTVIWNNQNSSLKTNESYYISWPCVCFTDESVYQQVEVDGKTYNEIDWDKAAQVYGDLASAQAPMSIEDFIADFDLNGQGGFIPLFEGIYDYPSIIAPILLKNDITWKGNSVQPKPCQWTQSGITYTGCTYITIQSFEPEFSDMEVTLNQTFGQYDAQGNFSGNTIGDLVLEGNPTVLGFSDLTLDGFELHVFNCGTVDPDSYWGWAYDEEFSPLQRYWAMWCGKSLTFCGENSNNEWMQSWDKEDILPAGESYPIVPVMATQRDYIFQVFNTALFAPENGALEGVWVLGEPKYTTKQVNGKTQIDKYLTTPKAYELQQAISCAAAEQDGFWGIWGGYYTIPNNPGKCLIGAGDKSVGFNFSIPMDGWNGHSIVGSSTEPYYYHYDSTNFDLMEERPTIGTANANVITGENSVEIVESNSPVVGVQYFNLQGQRLSNAPQQGIFIERAIKADGSTKAVKIVK